MSILYFLHSILRWAVLLFGVWAILNAISGLSSKRNYASSDKKIGLFFLISADIQLLIGLILYFTGPWFAALKNNAGAIMKDATGRFFAVEHMSMMIVAIAAIHIGYSATKKATTDNSKHKKSLIFFAIALIIILAAIPWPFREAIARPLLRGL
ncbi:hypothetical protein ACQ33O_06985 [Ferruginibacter sp. SUN002]|uniref:hypothetical protein n=1 Tax=Ferruginibacter sp. SUN002 TaxID=2937789 RepID=UPI003D36DA21